MSSKHILFIVILVTYISASVSRKRRECGERDCVVNHWSSWSACTAVQCGQSGTRQRTRTVHTSSWCNGKPCPSLLQIAPCQGTLPEDCKLSSWSCWSACSLLCGGSQTSTRHVVKNEKCGGTPCYSYMLSKTRNCKLTQCFNQGTLINGQCSCPSGYHGSCCQVFKGR